MNIQGSVSAWRPTYTSYAATKSNNNKMTTSYNGSSLEEWAKTDPQYTDSETGISWYVRDGKHPYMLDEDAEKFNQLCQETGEFPLKKFAEMTGIIQQIDENTTAYIGTNGTAIEGKDGRELYVDTSHMSYDMLMDLFQSLSGTGNYFERKYWAEQMRGV